MPPKYTAPSEAAMKQLRDMHHIGYPNQQAILDELAGGTSGMETAAYLLIEDAKERFPAFKAAREAEAYERDDRARELREMAINEKAAGPTFIDTPPQGQPINESHRPMPAGSLIRAHAAGAQPDETPEPPMAVSETAESAPAEPAAMPETAPDTSEAPDESLEDDNDWPTPEAQPEHTYDGDD